MRRRKDSYVGLTKRAKWAAAQKGDRVSASNSAPVVIASTSDEGVETASLQAAVARMPRQTPATSQLPPLHLRFQPANHKQHRKHKQQKTEHVQRVSCQGEAGGLLLAAASPLNPILSFELPVRGVCRRLFATGADSYAQC